MKIISIALKILTLQKLSFFPFSVLLLFFSLKFSFPFLNETVPVETVECLLEPSQRTFRNSAPVFLLLLTMDLRQGEFLNL